MTKMSFIQTKDAFEAWWQEQTADSDQWTTLERLAAKDAWFAAIKWEEE